MSLLKSSKNRGVHRITFSSEGKSSKVGAISTSRMSGNQKSMLPKDDLVDKELLSKDIKKVKSFKKTRNSSLAVSSRKELYSLDLNSENTWKNGPNTDENKREKKKNGSLEKRISHSSTLPGKLKSSSTKFLLSDEKSSVLKDIAVENKANLANNKLDKKPSQVLKTKMVTDCIYESYSNLEDRKLLKSASSWNMKSKDKENYDFKLDSLKHKRPDLSTMSEIGEVKLSKKRLSIKARMLCKFPIDSPLNSPRTARPKCIRISCLKPTRRSVKGTRRSERIAKMEKINYKL